MPAMVRHVCRRFLQNREEGDSLRARNILKGDVKSPTGRASPTVQAVATTLEKSFRERDLERFLKTRPKPAHPLTQTYLRNPAQTPSKQGGEPDGQEGGLEPSELSPQSLQKQIVFQQAFPSLPKRQPPKREPEPEAEPEPVPKPEPTVEGREQLRLEPTPGPAPGAATASAAATSKRSQRAAAFRRKKQAAAAAASAPAQISLSEELAAELGSFRHLCQAGRLEEWLAAERHLIGWLKRRVGASGRDGDAPPDP
eukprot:COSAG01_NODE_4475_length_4988_cov_16.399264_5_plen_255_part_00